MYLLAKKMGMSRFVDDSGKFIPCTLFKPLDQSVDLSSFVSDYKFFDVSGKTLGKGFAGPMKRYNFSGLRASHGVSASHRSHGSTGQCQDPGRVFKGKKMAGHMGNVNITVQNLKILSIYDGMIVLSGCVPGYEGSTAKIKKAVKKYGKA